MLSTGDDEVADDAEDAANSGAQRKVDGAFLPIPWVFTDEDIKMALRFGHKARPSKLAKELLALPCFARAEELRAATDLAFQSRAAEAQATMALAEERQRSVERRAPRPRGVR